MSSSTSPQKRKRVSESVVTFPSPEQVAATRAALVSDEAERAVLGAVLRDPAVYASVSEILQASDFYTLSHGFVWYAFDRIAERGEEIDLLTVADELAAQNQLQENTPALLADYAAGAPRTQSAESYARIVRDTATRLRVCDAAERMKAAALDRREFRQTEAMVDECNRLLFEATDQQISRASTDLKSLVSSFASIVETSMETGERRGIPTGFSNLDKLLRGALPGEMTIVAGAEGMGKTTFTLSLARSMARRGYGLVIFTLEMTQEEIVRILIGMESGIAKRALKALDLTQEQWSEFLEAAGKVSQWGIHVIDEFPTLTPIQLRRRLRTLMQAQKQPVSAVIIDGLWLMEATEKAPDRVDAVRTITRDVIGVARDFGVHIYMTHQYNGDAYRRNDKHPLLHDLAESAAVRRNAPVILGLYRGSYYDQPGESTEVHILKDRNGSGAQGRRTLFHFDAGAGVFLPAVEDV